MHLAHAPSRRGLAAAALAGAALLPAGCAGRGEKEISPTEDLMREHGILRRILVVYRETAGALRRTSAKIDAAALAEAAALFRSFGEDYHERRLEEQHVFPAVRRLGGEAGGLVDTLIRQHDRGRQLTAFIHGKSASGVIGTADAEPLANALDAFARMYEAHTAWEDTIVFQAWRKSLSRHGLEETGEDFEKIERDQFKGDGFDMAVARIAAIEQRLGLHDLAHFTAPAPV